MRNYDHLTRQLDIIPVKALGTPITIIGAGGIGSTTVFTLAKMGFANITVWDFDTVSVENMNNQSYRFKDIGMYKVQALADIVKEFTDIDLGFRAEKWEGQDLHGIVISAVDSMKVRKDIWSFVKNNPAVTWLIDPRMSAESALSFVMEPNSPKDQISYEKTLYSDEHANKISPEPCTARSTMYTTSLIGGYVAKHVKDIVTRSDYARVTQWNIGENILLNWSKSHAMKLNSEFSEGGNA